MSHSHSALTTLFYNPYRKPVRLTSCVSFQYFFMHTYKCAFLFSWHLYSKGNILNVLFSPGFFFFHFTIYKELLFLYLNIELRNHFFSSIVFHVWIYHSLFYQSPCDGHLGSVHPFAITDHSATNDLVCVIFMYSGISKGWIPRNGMLGQRVNALVIFKTIGKLLSMGVEPINTATDNVWMRVPVFPEVWNTVCGQTFEFLPNW